MKWFKDLLITQPFNVTQIPLNEMRKWTFHPDSGNIIHESGKFFTIHGLHIETNFGSVPSWEQPIINQNEVGILGIIKKNFNGVDKFLLQAKAEPGNIYPFQLSPTVQATKSNYTQVHKGNPTPYLHYFINSTPNKTLHDQLQVEQGGRFFKKRNRNMVVEVEDTLIENILYKWFSLNEISEAITVDDLINMDCRSVLFSLLEEHKIDNPLMTEDQILNFLTWAKFTYKLQSTPISLNKTKKWSKNEWEISSDSDLFYSIMAIRVDASREVQCWDQPILKDEDLGIIGLITTIINDTPHFLIQCRAELGYIDTICFAPTIQYSKFEKRLESGWSSPNYMEIFINDSYGKIIYDTIHSEEGGRFYHFRGRYIVKEIENYTDINVENNYQWVSYNQLLKFTKFGLSDIALRSLITCLELSKLNKKNKSYDKSMGLY